MATKTVTYRQLDHALTALGFVLTFSQGHLTYKHADSDTIVLLPLGESDDNVPIGYFIGAERVIVERGLVEDKEAFEALLTS